MIQEFICPNGRMSVNGVCPIFEGNDGQIKDFKKTSTYDAEKEDEFFKDRNKSFFEFDFEKPTQSLNKSANELINENVGSYNSFVENNLGISPSLQNLGTVVSTVNNFSKYGFIGAIAPFAVVSTIGSALSNLNNNQQQQAAINREEVKDLQFRIDRGDFGGSGAQSGGLNTGGREDYGAGGQYSNKGGKSDGGSKGGGFDSAERGGALHG